MSKYYLVHTIEQAIHFRNGFLNLNHRGKVHFIHGNSTHSTMLLNILPFNIIERLHIMFDLLFHLRSSFHSISRVGQNAVMLIWIHHWINHIRVSFELGVLVMSLITKNSFYVVILKMLILTVVSLSIIS